jgi:hypothetical protein
VSLSFFLCIVQEPEASVMAEYTVFVGNQDQGTAQFMQILGRMPPQNRNVIDVVPVQPDGAAPPNFVRGVPTLMSHESIPRIWEGTAAINRLSEIDPLSSPEGNEAMPEPGPGAPRPSAMNKKARSATAFIESLDGATAAAPPDDRRGFSSNSGKITQSEIDAYTQLRNNSMAMPPIAN